MDIKLGEHSIKEICRYAGFGTSTPDEMAMKTIREAMDIINKTALPKYVYKEFKECAFFSGKDIYDHIKGCHTIILMAATLGAGADGAIRKASYKDISLQLYVDACASTLIEEVCDGFEADLRKEVSARGEYLTGRFSPGYGDLPIETQKDFIASLNAQRLIGLTVSDSGMLIPSKSVTAVLGISSDQVKGFNGGCANCNIKDTCYLRRQGTPCGTH